MLTPAGRAVRGSHTTIQVNIAFTIPLIERELKAVVTGAGARSRRRGGDVGHVPRAAQHVYDTLVLSSLASIHDGRGLHLHVIWIFSRRGCRLIPEIRTYLCHHNRATDFWEGMPSLLGIIHFWGGHLARSETDVFVSFRKAQV